MQNVRNVNEAGERDDEVFVTKHERIYLFGIKIQLCYFVSFRLVQASARNTFCEMHDWAR